MLRVRLAAHPNRRLDANSLHLELRWRPDAPTREQASADFEAFRATFKLQAGQDLLQKLLFKSAHVARLSVLGASVHLHVFDSEIASYVGETGEFVTTSSSLLMVQANATITTTNTPTIARNLARPVSASIGDGLPRAEDVMQVISAYFLDRKDGGGKPSFRRLDQSIYLISFEVDGLRREVDPKTDNWELLDGTLVLVSHDQSVALNLMLDGRYTAAGLFASPPPNSAYRYDLEVGDYAAAFQTYTRDLLLTYLVPGIDRLPR